MSHREAVAAVEMVPSTGNGRRFAVRRRVRLGDASPEGRVRLDAIARYLQDVANDDARDAGAQGRELHGWVVRRTVIDVHEFPRYLAEIELTTWIGGLGAGWADRRTSVRDASGRSLVEASSLWVYVDTRTMRPQRLTPELRRLWGESAGQRKVRATTVLEPAAEGRGAVEAAWPMRRSDFDGFGHMNNAAYWEIVEEHLGEPVTVPLRCVVEHLDGVLPGEEVRVAADFADGMLLLRVDAAGTTKAMCCTAPLALDRSGEGDRRTSP